MKRWILMCAFLGTALGADTQPSTDDYLIAYQQGIEAINRKDYAVAMSHFQVAIKLRPQYTEAALRLTQCALIKQDLPVFQQGLEVLQKNQYSGLNADFYLTYGRLAKSKEQYTIAIDAALKGRIYDQSHTELLLLEATAHKAQGHWLTAIQRLEQAAINSRDPQVYNELADAYYQKGDANKAIENYKKTLEVDPLHPLALAQLGRLYLEQSAVYPQEAQSYLSQSVIYYKQYLTLYPQDTIVQGILKNISQANPENLSVKQ